MPIVLDGGTVDVSLKLDAAKPVESRPAFVCRYLSCRQVLEYQRIREAALSEKDEDKQSGMLDDALKIIVEGFKNMGDAKTVDDVLGGILTPQEKWELAFAALNAIVLSESDKKKSLFKSESTGNTSVPPAKTESATIPPAPPALSC